MRKFREHLDQMLNDDPELKREYDALETQYRIASDILKLRLARGLTQDELARRVNTQQPSIARIESARSLPTLAKLQQLADALEARLVVRLEPIEPDPPRKKSKGRVAKRLAAVSS
ncbi:MAG: helix-turn-helix transcriptional regulator [Dehalococcoidia bacterium]